MDKIIAKIPANVKYVTAFFMGVIVTLICLFVTSCAMIKSVKPDSPAEEFAEDIIEHYTGVEIDFSFDSPEA